MGDINPMKYLRISNRFKCTNTVTGSKYLVKIKILFSDFLLELFFLFYIVDA